MLLFFNLVFLSLHRLIHLFNPCQVKNLRHPSVHSSTLTSLPSTIPTIHPSPPLCLFFLNLPHNTMVGMRWTFVCLGIQRTKTRRTSHPPCNPSFRYEDSPHLLKLFVFLFAVLSTVTTTPLQLPLGLLYSGSVPSLPFIPSSLPLLSSFAFFLLCFCRVLASPQGSKLALLR